METQRVDEPSSPHADAPGDPQYAQSSARDIQAVK